MICQEDIDQFYIDLHEFHSEKHRLFEELHLNRQLITSHAQGVQRVYDELTEIKKVVEELQGIVLVLANKVAELSDAK